MENTEFSSEALLDADYMLLPNLALRCYGSRFSGGEDEWAPCGASIGWRNPHPEFSYGRSV